MNILVLYYYMRYPPRGTNLDHLYSFGRYSGHRVSYLNVAVQDVPDYAAQFPWDLIIFHDLFVCSRWTRSLLAQNMEKVRCFENTGIPKAVIPQDEFISMDMVCDLINQFKVRHVFSVSPETEWATQYRTVDRERVKFHKVLTGYIDDGLKERVSSLADEVTDRPIDLGYRSHHVPYWLGRHAQMKWQIADVFRQAAEQKGLLTDISVRDEDTITGDDWYRYLLSCKYQLGIEGGASILDWDGSYQAKVDKYLASRPDASYEEVEAACFHGAEGSLKLYALSPRHLECCLTRTCQVLIEGEYGGVLKPWVHYIPVKKDLSNLERVIDIIQKDHLRERIVQRCWDDIVKPGEWTYRKFADYVISQSLDRQKPQGWGFVVHKRLRVLDCLSWVKVWAMHNPEVKKWHWYWNRALGRTR